MVSYPPASEVLADLGDKVLDGLARAVALTEQDLRSYRAWHPDIVADHSERGLANWLHDRVWRHLTVALGGDPDVHFHDAEPTREFYVGLKYRFRVKRHGEEGTVRAYPTQTVLEFMVQPMLSGDAEVRLVAGYEWDRTTRAVGSAVVSLHNGVDELVWLVRLPASGAGEAGGVEPVPPVSGPTAPTIEVGGNPAQAPERRGEGA